MEPYYILIVGTRTFQDYEVFCRVLEAQFEEGFPNSGDYRIVSGGASGADALAKRYAMEHHLEYIEFPAKWDVYGKRAGYIRNQEMHKFIAQFPNRMCIAFWDGESKGTYHSIPLAQKFRNNIIIYNYRMQTISSDFSQKEIPVYTPEPER